MAMMEHKMAMMGHKMTMMGHKVAMIWGDVWDYIGMLLGDVWAMFRITTRARHGCDADSFAVFLQTQHALAQGIAGANPSSSIIKAIQKPKESTRAPTP